MKNELYVLKKLTNPYIVKLYCHFVVNNVLYIFIKLANGGNFAKYVKDKVMFCANLGLSHFLTGRCFVTQGVLTEHESSVFFGQILVALEYMHSLSIAHRDVKLENVHKHGTLSRSLDNLICCLIGPVGATSQPQAHHSTNRLWPVSSHFNGKRQQALPESNLLWHACLHVTRNFGWQTVRRLSSGRLGLWRCAVRDAQRGCAL